MSRLAELRKRRTAPHEPQKNLYSLESELTELTKGTSVSFVSSIPEDIQFFLQSAMAAPATPETPVPTGTEPQNPPEPKERLCYQCQHFQRSPYGFPLGLCRQHGMPEGSLSDVRGDRIQHAASRPVHFGCISFQLRAPDTNLCTACRNYHPASTMCRVVNTGCPYSAIPPCTGAHFQPKEGRS